MSQENVDQFKRGAEASNRRDIEALVETLDPEVEWTAFPGVWLGEESEVYRGHAGIREMSAASTTWSTRSTSSTRRSGTSATV